MAGGVGEAALILGVISSIISIVDETKKIWDAAHDTSGLPKAFREVNSKLPLVKSTLDEAKRQNLNTQRFATEVEPVLRSCEDDAQDLKTIFSKVIPPDGAPWYDRYSKAAKSVKPGRTRKVESLMGDVLKNLQILESHHIFTNVATTGDLQTALQNILQIEKEEPSLPDDPSVTINSTGQGSNFNTGSGTQKNQQTFGTGATWNVENYHAAQVDSLISRSPNFRNPCIVLPYETVAAYSPRIALSASLAEKLGMKYRGPRLAHAVVVTGLGGTGKTQLVLDYVEKHKHEYDTVVWLNASSEQSLRSSFAACCEELHLQPPTWWSSSSRIEDEASIRAALRWFHQRREDQKWLVVLDNADDASQCSYDVVPKGVGGSLIITSRDKRASRLVDNKGESIEVDAMQLDEAVSLLLHSAGITEHKIQGLDQSLPEQIVNQLDRLPLAVSLAGAAISDEFPLGDDVEATLRNYLTDLGQHRDVLLRTENSAGLSSYDKTIWTVWGSTFSAIERSNPDVPAVQLLTFLTYLDRSFIPHELFRMSALRMSALADTVPPALEKTLLPEWLQSLLAVRGAKEVEWDDHRYRATIKPLLLYGLVRPVSGPTGMRGLTMHGLVRWRAEHQAEHESFWIPYVVWMYMVLLSDAKSMERRPSRWNLPHLPSTKALRDNLHLPSAQLCEILEVFADAEQSARRWQRAERLYIKLFEITKDMEGDTNVDAKRRFRHEIGEIQFHRKFQDEESVRGSDIKRRTEAAILIEKIFESERLELGAEHAMTLSTGTNLVGVYFRQGKETRASELAAELLKALTHVLGPLHKQTLMCTLHAAWKGATLAELTDNLETQSNVLREAIAQWDEEHPVAISAMRHVAGTYSRLGRGPEAEELFRKIIEIQSAVLGSAHPDTLADMRKLANLFLARGSTAEADALLAKVNTLFSEYLETTDDLNDGLNQLELFDAPTGSTLEQVELLRELQRRLDSNAEAVNANLSESYPKYYARLSGLYAEQAALRQLGHLPRFEAEVDIWKDFETLARSASPQERKAAQSRPHRPSIPTYYGRSWQNDGRGTPGSGSSASELARYSLDEFDDKPILVYKYRGGAVQTTTQKDLVNELDKSPELLRVTKKPIPRYTSRLDIQREDLLLPDEYEDANKLSRDSSLASVKIPASAYWSRLFFGNYSDLYILSPEREPVFDLDDDEASVAGDLDGEGAGTTASATNESISGTRSLVLSAWAEGSTAEPATEPL